MKNEKEALTLTKLFSDLHLTGYIIFFLFLNFFGQLLKWNHDNNFSKEISRFAYGHIKLPFVINIINDLAGST